MKERSKYIQIPVDEEEKKILEKKAKEVGLTLPFYLKLLGMTNVKITTSNQ